MYAKLSDPIRFCLFDISVQSSRFGEATVFLVFFDITMQRSPLGWGTVQSYLFRYTNAEFDVGRKNGSIFSIFYVDMGTDSVSSFLMQQCRVRC